MKKYLFVIGILIQIMMLSCQQKAVENQNWQWRGENRNGMYLNETGLLKEWAADGPELLWYFDGLGEGYSSVAIANGRIYATGLDDDDLVLFVFDMNGTLLKRRVVGKEWTRSYIGPRGTVNVNDGKLYIFNSLGTLFCLDEATLNEVWSVNVIEEFDGRFAPWGLVESPLIVGDKIFITPGGEIHNMIALNKKTGELIWTSPGLGEISSYCSPLFINGYSVPIVVTNMDAHIIAFNADTGEVLWYYPQQRNWDGDNPNIPIYSDGMVFTTSGYRGGSMMFRLINDGQNIEPIWKNNVDNLMGGAIRVGDYLYLSGENYRGWFCVNWHTGEIVYRVEGEIGSIIIYADGMFYVYTTRGIMKLIKPNPERYELVSSFEVTMGTNQHWAHPVIHNGVLYIRRGDTLMAYKIK